MPARRGDKGGSISLGLLDAGPIEVDGPPCELAFAEEDAFADEKEEAFAEEEEGPDEASEEGA